MNRTHKIYLVCLSLLILLCSSCSYQDELNNPLLQNDGKSNVSIKLKTPANFDISFTKGLTTAEENTINDVYIFGFKTGIVSYVKTVDEIDNNSFNVMLQSSKDAADTYKLMIIANAEEILYPLLGPSLDGLDGKTYGEVQQLLKQSEINSPLFSSGGKITMWGELDYQEINSTNNQFTVSLLRTIARVDVGLGAIDYDPVTKLANWGGLDDFTLEEVYVYNPNNAYYFIPIESNFDATNKTVTKPSVVGNKLSEPLKYSVTGEKSSVRDIYLPEADIRMGDNPKSGDENHLKRMALVVKGSYKGNSSTYYRIDFINKDKEITNALRNYLYQFNIKNVTGNGYKTPEKAYESSLTNIEVEVLEWNDGEINEIVFDGQYYLGVNKGEFELPLYQQTNNSLNNKLSIITNHPDGWTIEKITDEYGDFTTVNWISTTLYHGAANLKTTLSIITDANISDKNRVAYIYLSAGRLTYKVKVTQTIIPDLTIKITDGQNNEITDLFFDPNVGGTVDAKSFNVAWDPINTDLNISIVPINGSSINFESGYSIEEGVLNDPMGFKTFTIKPLPLHSDDILSDPFAEKKLRVDFTINSFGTYITKSLYIIQRNYNAIPDTEVNFLMDGSSDYFTIKANAPWEIEIVSDPQNIIQTLQTTIGGFYENKKDEEVWFTTNNLSSDLSNISGEVIFKIKSTHPNKSFSDNIFSLFFYNGVIQPQSNTYILSAITENSSLIPILRANEVFPGSIGEKDKLSTELIWTDEFLHLNNTIIKPVGRGYNGYVFVHINPNGSNLQGNDVIAVKVNGTIKWSWHLWIVDYDPETEGQPSTLNGMTLMSRNLGALNNDLANRFSIGTYYQWGRKDPFPPAQNTGTNTSETIYNKGGNTIASIPTSPDGSLLFSVQNPLTYLTSSQNWTGSDGANSWDKNGKKTLFDPCPPGWKVPPTSLWSGLNIGNFVWKTEKGRLHNTAGWFPAAGERASTSPNLGSVGGRGLYWSSTYRSSTIQTLDYDFLAVYTTAAHAYTKGGSVRCIKE